MGDDITDHVNPVWGKPPIDPAGEHPRGPHQPASTRTISGTVVRVTRGNVRHREQHTLDVSVGGDAYTEITIRVPDRDYSHLEGRRVFLHIEE